MYLLGYSLDNLSLMAITLAVGFVVDDAIVMLENIVRHMEMGKPPMQAAYDGSKEIAFTILSMTVSLVAVFIPVLFMGGIVGRLLREFAVTITAAILVSGFMSISLTPMLCSRFLRPPHDQRHGWLYNVFERMFDAWRRVYDVTLSGVFRFRPVVMAVSIVLLARDGVSVHCGAEGVPAERGPGPLQRQHRRRAGHRVQGHGGPSAEGRRRPDEGPEHRQHRRQRRADGQQRDRRVEHRPHVRRAQAASASVTSRSIEVIASLRPKLAEITGIRAFMLNQPPINLGGGGQNRALYQFIMQDTDTDELYRWAPVLEAQIRQMPGFEDVSSDLQLNNPQVTVEMDRDKLSSLGLTATQVETALYNAYGTRQVSQIYAPEQSVSGDPARRSRVPDRSRRRCRCSTCARTAAA